MNGRRLRRSITEIAAPVSSGSVCTFDYRILGRADEEIDEVIRPFGCCARRSCSQTPTECPRRRAPRSRPGR